MLWSEFLIHILRAQAQTLQHLAAFFGEAELLELLESAGESAPDLPEPSFKIKKEWLPTLTGPDTPSTYLELEGAVHDLHLSAVLEFHLWTYPFYRIIIESSANLKAKVPDQPGARVLEVLVDEAMIQAQTWVRTLPVPPTLLIQTRSIAQVPWLRFRTTVLGKTGRRPVIALS